MQKNTDSSKTLQLIHDPGIVCQFLAETLFTFLRVKTARQSAMQEKWQKDVNGWSLPDYAELLYYTILHYRIDIASRTKQTCPSCIDSSPQHRVKKNAGSEIKNQKSFAYICKQMMGGVWLQGSELKPIGNLGTTRTCRHDYNGRKFDLRISLKIAQKCLHRELRVSPG